MIVDSSYASFVEVGDGNSYYHLNRAQAGTQLVYGTIYMAAGLNRFTKSIAIKVRASGTNVGIVAKWTPTGGSDYYWDGEEWGSSYPSSNRYVLKSLNVSTEDASEAASVEFTIPAHGETSAGFMYLYIVGYCDVFDVDLRPIMNKGYRDEIVIDNGARGEGDSVSITGGRMTSDDYSFTAPEMQGVWLTNAVGGDPIYLFTDNNFAVKDFMSLQALGRALSVALPRVETSGVLDFPSTLTFHPLFVKSHNDWALVSSFDWNLKESEFSFKAVTLPTASLVVDSETITTK